MAQVARRYMQRRRRGNKSPLAASEAVLIEMMEMTVDLMRHAGKNARKKPLLFLKVVDSLLDQTQALARLEQQPGFVPQAAAMQQVGPPPVMKFILMPKSSEAPALVPKGAIVDVQAVRQITGGSDAKE